MWPLLLIGFYCVLVAAASLLGGMLPSLVRLTHTRMQTIMSFVGGLVLGVGLLHLLPHSAAETGSLQGTVYSTLAGLLTMFFLIRIFHVHQHGPIDETECHHHSSCDDPHHTHHVHPIAGEHCDMHRHPFSWMGLAAGLAAHTLIDGMAMAASVSAESKEVGTGLQLFGLGTFLAVLLHKPLDAMSITTVMAAGNWSHRAQHVVNVIFSLMCTLGALLFCLGIRQFGESEPLIVGYALGFAAGVFLCISLADILPEVQFHVHDRFKLSAALVLGIAVAYAIGFLEPEHQHNHTHPHAVNCGLHVDQDGTST